MTKAYPIIPLEETMALALQVVAWTLSDERRAARLLDVTGLDPDDLRAGLGRPAMLRALIDFVLDHEPDLIACADALGIDPADIVAARARLAR
jgi:adenine/guanine phosphoribosyltransferase-like PRPP-binding protein